MKSAGPRGRTRRQVLGRHSLASPGILARIVAAVDPRPDDLVIEVGPGSGVLTVPLAGRAGRVAAVEKDSEAVKRLRKNPLPNVEIIEGDILNVDLAALAGRLRSGLKTVKLVGNLPYSISSPFLHKVLDERAAFDRAAFLVQKEVAEKVCAAPGGKDYGPLSIRLQAQFRVRLEFSVRPGAFVPPPKVESAFFTLEKREKYAVPDAEEPAFGRFLRAAFSRRRRTLRNNLLSAGLPAGRIDEALEGLGIAPSARPEEVPPGQFFSLFRRIPLTSPSWTV